MTQLGDLGIGLEIDFSQLDQQLRQLERRKVNPLKLEIGINAQSLNTQLKTVKLNPIAVQLVPDIENFKRQFKSLKVECGVAFKVDLDSLKQIGKRQYEVSVRAKVDTSDLDRQIKQLRKTDVVVALKTNSDQVRQQIESSRSRAASPIETTVNLRYKNERKQSDSINQKVEIDTKGLEDSVAKSVEKGTRQSQKKGIFSSLIDIPKNALGNTISTFNAEVTRTYAAKYAQGSLKKLEEDLGRITGGAITSLDQVGERVSVTFGRIGGAFNERLGQIGKFAGQRVSQRLGLEEKIDSLKKQLQGLEQQSNAAFGGINTRPLNQKLTVLELQTLKLVQGLLEFKDVSEQIGNLKGLGKALADDVQAAPFRALSSLAEKQFDAIKKGAIGLTDEVNAAFEQIDTRILNRQFSALELQIGKLIDDLIELKSAETQLGNLKGVGGAAVDIAGTTSPFQKLATDKATAFETQLAQLKQQLETTFNDVQANGLSGQFEKLNEQIGKLVQGLLEFEAVEQQIGDLKGVGAAIATTAQSPVIKNTPASPEQAFDRSYQNLVQRTAAAAGLKPLTAEQIPSISGSNELPKIAGAAYFSKQNQVKLPTAKFEAIRGNILKDISEFTDAEIATVAKQVAVIGHEVFHGAQYGFSGKNKDELAAAGGVQVATPRLTDQERKNFVALRGASVEKLADASTSSITGSEHFSKLKPEQQRTTQQISQELEAGAYAYEAKLLTAFLVEAKAASGKVGTTVADVMDRAIGRVATDLETQMAQVKPTAEGSGGVGGNAQLAKAQQSLQAYSNEVLKELSRIAGLGGKGNKAELIQGLVGLDPQELQAAFNTLKPYIENGGKSLKKVEQSDVERTLLARISESEKRVGDVLRLVQSAEGERRQQLLAVAENEINQTKALINKTQGKLIAPETRTSIGRTKGRLSGFQLEFDRAKTAEPIPAEQLQPKTPPRPKQEAKQLQSEVDTALGALLGGVEEAVKVDEKPIPEKPTPKATKPTSVVKSTAEPKPEAGKADIPVRLQKPDTSELEKQLQAIQEKLGTGIAIKSHILPIDISILNAHLKKIREQLGSGIGIKAHVLPINVSVLEAHLKKIQEQLGSGIAIKSHVKAADTSLLEKHLKKIQEQLGSGIAIKAHVVPANLAPLETQLKAIQEKLRPGLSVSVHLQLANPASLETELKTLQAQLQKGLSVPVNLVSLLDIEGIQKALADAIAAGFQEGQARAAVTPRNEAPEVVSQPTTGAQTVQAAPQPPPVAAISTVEEVKPQVEKVAEEVKQLQSEVEDALGALLGGLEEVSIAPSEDVKPQAEQVESEVKQLQDEVEDALGALLGGLESADVPTEDVKPQAEKVEREVKQLQSEVDDALGALLGGLEAPKVQVAPPKIQQKTEADLNKYTVEILKELNRISGLGTKGNKADLIKNLLGLDPAQLEAAVKAVEPLIEQGPKGGQKLKKVEKSDAETKNLGKLTAAEERIDLRLKQFQQSQGKKRQEIADTALKEIEGTLGFLDALGKQPITADSRLEIGQSRQRVQAAKEQFAPQKKEANLDNIGLARVDVSGVGAQIGSQLQQVGAGGKGAIAQVQKGLAQAGKQQQLDLQKVYEALVQEAAKLSNVGIKPGDIPKLTIDDGKLKQLGTRALYEAKENQIVVTQALADLLSSSLENIEQNQNLVADILHEARHALQLDFGRTSLNQIAAGQASFGVETTSPYAASEETLSAAKKSVAVANQQADGQLSGRQKKAIARAEVDAYEFEKKATPKAVQALSGLDLNLSKPQAEMSKLSQLLRLGGDGVGFIRDKFKSLESQLNEMVPAFGGLGSGIKNAVLGFVAFQVLGSITQQIAAFSSESLDAALKFNNLKTALDFASGSSTAGTKNLEFVRKTVDDLKIPLGAAQQGFKQLAASTRGTSSQGQTTRDLFTGVSQASTVLGLTTEQTDGTFTALSQMASKGKVQAEELRGQLAERIPGAFGIAARAMSVTEAELNKMLETGSVVSDEFLPKFAKQLQVEFGGAAVNASKNAQSAIFAFQNAILKVQESIGQTLQPGQVAILNAFTAGIELLGNNMKVLGDIILSTALITGLKFIAPFIKLEPVMVAANAAIGFLQQGLGLLSALISGKLAGSGLLLAQIFTGLRTLLKTFLAEFILPTAAFESVKTLFALFQTTELGNQFRDFADQAVAGLKRVEEAGRKAKGEMPQPQGPSNLKSEGFDLTLGMGGAVGLQNGIRTDDLITAFRQIPGVNQFKGFVEGATGGAVSPFTTVAEKKFNDQKLDIAKFNEATYAATGQALDTESLKGQITQVDGIDSQLKDLQIRKKKLSDAPQVDKNAVNDLSKQEQDLLQKRQNAAAPLLENQGLITNNLKNARAALEAIDQQGLPADKAKELKDLWGAAVANLEAAEKNLNRVQASGKNAVDPIRKLNNAFTEIAKNLADVAEKSEKAFQNRAQQINAKQLQGFSTNQDASRISARERAENDRDKLKTQIEGSEKALAGKQAAIDDPSIQQKLSGITTSSGKGISLDSNLSEIEDAKSKLKDQQAGEKLALERLKEFKEAEKQLNEQKTQLGQSELSVKQAREAEALGKFDRTAQDQAAGLQRKGSDRQLAILKGQLGKFGPKLSARDAVALEGDVAIKSAQSELDSTKQTQTNNSQQLTELRNLKQQGLISAEEFYKREQELVNQSADLKVKAAQQELAVKEAVQKKALSLIEFEAQQRENATKRAESNAAVVRSGRQANVVRLRSQKRITEDDAAVMNADIQSQSAQDEAKFAGQRENSAAIQLQQLQQAFKTGKVSSEEFYKRQADLTNQLGDLKARKAQAQLQIEEAAAAKIEAINRKIINQFELAIKKAEAAIAMSQTNRGIAAKQDLIAAGGGGELADQATANAQTVGEIGASQQRMALKQQELAFNRQMVAEGRRDAREGAEKEIALLQEIAQLKADQTDKELQMIKQLRQTRINYQNGLFALQQKEMDLQGKLLDSQKQLVDAYNGLQKARNDAASSGLQSQSNKLDKGLDLAKGLKEGRFKGEQETVAREQLSAMGFSSDPAQAEKEIVEAKAKIEDQIAQKKAEALNMELEMQQRSLEIEEIKFKLAQRKAELEARKEVRDAKLKLEDSNLAVKQAEKGVANAKTPEEKKAANAALEKARLDQSLAKDELKSAGENYLAVDSMGQMGEQAFAFQRQGLAITADAKRSEFQGGEDLRKMNQRMDLAGVGSTNFNANAGVGNILYGKSSSGPDMSGFAPSQQSQQMLQKIMKGSGIEIPGINPRSNDVGSRVSQADNDSSQSRAEMKQMYEQIKALAAKPSEIHVSSPQPVQDAAKVYRDVQRNRIATSSSF